MPLPQAAAFSTLVAPEFRVSHRSTSSFAIDTDSQNEMLATVANKTGCEVFIVSIPRSFALHGCIRGNCSDLSEELRSRFGDGTRYFPTVTSIVMSCGKSNGSSLPNSPASKWYVPPK